MFTEEKKTFLLEASRLYEAMILLTDSEVIRRYLAFRIIVNAMAFEDLIGKRSHARFRQIRNVLLAHTQEDGFFAGYQASNEITNASISPLVTFMSTETQTPDNLYLIPELAEQSKRDIFNGVLPLIFHQYHSDFLSGHRMINNHLCHTGTSIQEVTQGELPGVFYRYHSSMALFQLAQYIYNNTVNIPELLYSSRHSKLDMLLHAQNLCDTIFKDMHNSYSINGLLEVITTINIGDSSPIKKLQLDSNFIDTYKKIRNIRNKLIGHMDSNSPLTIMLSELDTISMNDIYTLVNSLDKAVSDVSNTHISIRARFITGNQLIEDTSIIDIQGLQQPSYF